MKQFVYHSYRRKGMIWLRPFEAGESLEGISLSQEDAKEVQGPGPYGFVAMNPLDVQDKWYVSHAYAAKNYEPMELMQEKRVVV